MLPSSAFVTGLTACVGTNSNKNTEQVEIHQQVQADTFETDKKVRTIQPKEFNNEDKLFQKAIFQALPHIKDGKLLSKFEAFKQNSEDGPYKIEFERKFFDFLKSLPENTDDKIVKFNNPLSDKEFNVIKDIITLKPGPLCHVDLVDARQEGDKLIFNYNTSQNYPEGEHTLEYENTIGLN